MPHTRRTSWLVGYFIEVRERWPTGGVRVGPLIPEPRSKCEGGVGGSSDTKICSRYTLLQSPHSAFRMSR